MIPSARKPDFEFSKIVLVDIGAAIFAGIAGVISIVSFPCILCGVALNRSIDDETQDDTDTSSPKLESKVTSYKLAVCTI